MILDHQILVPSTGPASSVSPIMFLSQVLLGGRQVHTWRNGQHVKRRRRKRLARVREVRLRIVCSESGMVTRHCPGHALPVSWLSLVQWFSCVCIHLTRSGGRLSSPVQAQPMGPEAVVRETRARQRPRDSRHVCEKGGMSMEISYFLPYPILMNAVVLLDETHRARCLYQYIK